MHLLVMDQHLRWKAFEDPDVFEGFIWGHPVIRIPYQALLDEVLEVGVLISNDECKWLAKRLAQASPRVLAHDGLRPIRHLREELLFAAGHGQDSWIGYANHLHQA